MSSSSSSISTTTVNGVTRVTGLASGIDVDSIVDQLMTAEKAKKYDKLDQKEQLAEWRQEAYQSVITDIQDFASTYLDVSSSDSILSAKNFEEYAVESSSAAVTATYTSAAEAGSHTVSVSQLATASSLSTTGTLSGDLTGTSTANYSSAAGKSFVITLDGTDYTVTLGSSASSVTDLQSAIDSAVGDGKVSVSESSGKITIAAEDSGVNVISVSSTSSDTTDKVLGYLGLTDGQSNRISTSSTLSALSSTLGFSFNSDSQLQLTINGTAFTFDASDTLASMMKEINNSDDVDVTMAYDETSDKLTLTADDTGAGDLLTVTEGTASTFLSTCLGTSTAGTDCKLTIDNVSYTRSSNTITIDGVTYTANQETTSSTAATVTLTQDVDAVYENIANFVSAYNELIDTINGKLNEEYDSDYAPLTDAQEDDMDDDEITDWNEKAKVGLLESDDTLQSMVDDLRTALSDYISGVSLNLSDIGITTSSDYDEEGKLYIDEDTLKEAIQDNPDEIVALFTQTATSVSGTTAAARTLTSSQLQTRYQEEGLAYRLYDIVAKNISTIRDSSGNKGLLIEEAGISGDSSQTDNTLYNEIQDLQDALDEESDRLDDYEERLYDRYDYLETYISTMNTQLSAISSLSSSS